MLNNLWTILKKQKLIEEANDGSYGSVSGVQLIQILNSPEYLNSCPKVNDST